MTKQALVTQRRISYVLALVLLLGGGLVGCKSAPPAPETVPEGPDVSVRAGETIAIRASAEGAVRYEWTLEGAGEILGAQTPTIRYNAPTDELGVAILSVTAHSDRGASPPTSLTIDVLCPTTASAEGTVPPAVAISSITFAVNGDELDDSESLQASVDDQVEAKEVTICVDPFEVDGGQVYVEFDPVIKGGKTITYEVKGTRAVAVDPGFTTIPGPGYTWTIGENWQHFSVVTVHYPPGGTENLDCEEGLCEVDDRVIVPIQ